jgi:hypothetical protein
MVREQTMTHQVIYYYVQSMTCRVITYAQKNWCRLRETIEKVVLEDGRITSVVEFPQEIMFRGFKKNHMMPVMVLLELRLFLLDRGGFTVREPWVRAWARRRRLHALRRSLHPSPRT